MRGKLIVFEGSEGGGKSTQIEKLRHWLVTHPWWQELGWEGATPPKAIATREPGGTELGDRLREMLLYGDFTPPLHDRAELFLYAADRAQHVETFLKPHLEAGNLILCDRYVDSTIAYQGYGRGGDLDWIRRLNQMATNGLESDLTFWLDVDVEVGLHRARQSGKISDRMEQAHLDFHRRVRQGYADLVAKQPDRKVRIDANQPAAEVTVRIQEILGQHLRKWFASP
ncbi:dTMP kinase [Geitlerinema sp. PCC 9228]|jgi:dTMP kinase|uniref:dTMP kinase n=1 Tax=Geitlerinema sp. PCC 9228 TaxID=111611 RepID=UPI0008F98E21|nr:dTMP kinase [Geitlerinema sp. PCC 9228]